MLKLWRFKMATAIVSHNDTLVDVQFEYTRGYPANLSGHPDSWSPEEPDELEIIEVRWNGMNILPLLSEGDMENIEMELYGILVED
jgi:hypothetical protein